MTAIVAAMPEEVRPIPGAGSRAGPPAASVTRACCTAASAATTWSWRRRARATSSRAPPLPSSCACSRPAVSSSARAPRAR